MADLEQLARALWCSCDVCRGDEADVAFDALLYAAEDGRGLVLGPSETKALATKLYHRRTAVQALKRALDGR
jgi:hypothetical protein